MPKGKYGKYSPKQKKIAAMAGDPKVLEGEDFAKLRNKKGMKEGGMYKEYGHGGLHSEKRIVKTRGTGAATKGLNFHSSD
jgi:hypothetical protein|tara:strand:- start:1626 stop:1865 length:240 start_codon:yes stop_codon:yes gene_type:complete